AAVLLLAGPAYSQDCWPQWRGPNRDGVVHGVRVPARWPKALAEEWRVPVGEGISSPVVVGQSVYVFARQNESEVLLCLDPRTGKEKWRTEPYPAPFTPRVGHRHERAPGVPRRPHPGPRPD